VSTSRVITSRVIIVGAGLGGLALAHGLLRRGFDVAVYERDPHPGARPQGYRIQLDEPGLTGLRRCLPEQLLRLCLATSGEPPPLVSVRDRGLRRVADRAAAAQTPNGPAPRPRAFDRPTLRRILLAGLGDTVRHGAALRAYELTPGGRVTARFADGRAATADLLVGADGVGSTVRRLLLPAVAVEDAGLRLIYGKIPLDGSAADLPGWVFDALFTVVAAGPGQPHVGLGPVRFGRPPELAGLAHEPPIALPATHDYLALMVGAPADHPAMPSLARLRALGRPALHELAGRLLGDDWHPDVRRLLDRWRTGSLFPLRISTAGSVPTLPPGPVTLLGDAVHAMSPVLAMGANTALRDAGELVTVLSEAAASGVGLEAAVGIYQRRMTAYAGPLVAGSRRTGQARVGQR
jgi:2-polyprenyl-6-methoxyphenol hydroxylase-like FAD-dependent oxidoreductase